MRMTEKITYIKIPSLTDHRPAFILKPTQGGAVHMDLNHYFSVWNRLTPAQKELVSAHLICRSIKKGTILYNGSSDCLGLVLIKKGQLRAYMISEDGREVTLYRLLEQDICLFSASCIMKNIQFDITIEAEKDSEICIIPAVIYKRLMEESTAVSNYTNEIMAARFSEVMWLIEQIMWKTFDRRLAAFLLEEMALEEGSRLKITHEIIAGHLGTAREVVTRMLRYFQEEGMVKLSRGVIDITDEKLLRKLAGS